MAITVQQVITEARGLLQDTVATYRYSDTDLVQYASDCLDLLAEHLPHLFVAVRQHTCAEGARQNFSQDGSKGVVDVIEVSGGGAVKMVDRELLDRFSPRWRVTARQGAATQWMPYPGDRFMFDVYPPSSAGQVLNVHHVATPPELAISDTLDHRLTPYSNLLVDYVVGIAEAREAEEVGPQREQAFINKFLAKVKGAAK